MGNAASREVQILKEITKLSKKPSKEWRKTVASFVEITPFWSPEKSNERFLVHFKNKKVIEVLYYKFNECVASGVDFSSPGAQQSDVLLLLESFLRILTSKVAPNDFLIDCSNFVFAAHVQSSA